jgi:hypothetical protein
VLWHQVGLYLYTRLLGFTSHMPLILTSWECCIKYWRSKTGITGDWRKLKMNVIASSIHLVLFRFEIGMACNACLKGRISYKIWFGGIILKFISRERLEIHDLRWTGFRTGSRSKLCIDGCEPSVQVFLSITSTVAYGKNVYRRN